MFDACDIAIYLFYNPVTWYGEDKKPNVWVSQQNIDIIFDFHLCGLRAVPHFLSTCDILIGVC